MSKLMLASLLALSTFSSFAGTGKPKPKAAERPKMAANCPPKCTPAAACKPGCTPGAMPQGCTAAATCKK